MKTTTFTNKFGLLNMVLSGQKTMFRLVSRKRGNRVLHSTKYNVGDKVIILQSYSDLGFEPDRICMEEDEDGHYVKMFAKDTKGWNRASSVDPRLMPHVIEITDVKTEPIQVISDHDCFKEGIVPVDTENLQILDGNMPFEGYSLDGKSWAGDTPQEVFQTISNTAVKKDAWLNNKEVDCYTFKLIQ